MARRSPARWIAPLSLLGAAAAILIVVSSHSGKSSGDKSVTSSSSGAPQSTTTATTTTTSASGKRFYIVKTGDVLSGIAAKTGVPLEQIQRLNPDVDAQSLQAGQKLKLVP